MNKKSSILYPEAVKLLQQLIGTPSFSKEESETATLLVDFLHQHNIATERIGNNIIAHHPYFDAAKPTLLLNSHHDTVRPNEGYTRDPFAASIENDKLFGLGSNDAGACLVALIAAFIYFYHKPDLPYNILLAATAEEEISGAGGIEMVLPRLPKIDCAIVGEPTKLDLAIAERGLLVLDAVAMGKSGHAARNEGVNAIEIAIDDIQWIRGHRFDRSSPLLGESKATVTALSTPNRAHNVVPAECHFVIDVRVNECYTLEEMVKELQANLRSSIKPRSMRIRPTMIESDHPLVKAGRSLGRTIFGSPTTSDKALMPFPALKTGPGDSGRSHTPNEYIYTAEIQDGIEHYINLIEHLQQSAYETLAKRKE